MSHKFNNYGLVTSFAAATLLSLCLTSNGNVKADTQSPVNIEQKNKSAELIKQNSDISTSAQQTYKILMEKLKIRLLNLHQQTYKILIRKKASRINHKNQNLPLKPEK